MAVYIPKHRLGSGGSGSSEQRGQTLKQRIEGLSSFKAMQDNLARAKENRQSQLKEKHSSNSEVQRWRTLTAEEKGREAIDRLVPTTKEVLQKQRGGDVSYEDARKVAEDVANLSDRKKTEK